MAGNLQPCIYMEPAQACPGRSARVWLLIMLPRRSVRGRSRGRRASVNEGTMIDSSDGGAKSTLYCSFCGKSQHEVRKLIAGPNVFICNECVELCADIIKEEDRKVRKASGPSIMTPAEINAVLDDYVVGQEQAKRVLSVAVHNH